MSDKPLKCIFRLNVDTKSNSEKEVPILYHLQEKKKEETNRHYFKIKY